MHTLIGLCGYAGVGKNTIADALGFPQLAFAGALKRDLAPILEEKLGLNIFASRENKVLARELLVAYGRLGRKVNPAHWLEELHKDYLRHKEAAPLTVTDVRYLNEVLYILNQGGIVFYISRPGVEAANDEERDSIADIWSAWTDDEIKLEYLTNGGTPEEAAQSIRQRLHLNKGGCCGGTCGTNLREGDADPHNPAFENLDTNAIVAGDTFQNSEPYDHPEWTRLIEAAGKYQDSVLKLADAEFSTDAVANMTDAEFRCGLGEDPVDKACAIDPSELATWEGPETLAAVANHPVWKKVEQFHAFNDRRADQPEPGLVTDPAVWARNAEGPHCIEVSVDGGVLTPLRDYKAKDKDTVTFIHFHEYEAPPGFYFEKLPLANGGGVLVRVKRFFSWLMQ